MRATNTVDLVGQFALKGVLYNIVALINFQKALYLLHKGIVKLISIALDHWIYGSSFIGNEGIAEFLDGNASLASVLKARKNVLQLIDLILIQGRFILLAFY